MNAAMRRSSLSLQRRVLASSLSESKTMIQLRQVHSTIGSSYANDMQQQQQQQQHVQYSSSSTAANSVALPFFRMTTNSFSTPPTTTTMDDGAAVCDAYDFGYRVVSPFEAEQYTATTCQSYDDGHYSAFKDDTPATTISSPLSGV